MDALLLIIGIVVVALIALRPSPRPTIVYVPVEVPAERGGLGCLQLIVIISLAVVLLAVGGGPN